MDVIVCRFMSIDVHVRLSALAHRRSTENMSKDGFSYRCKPRTSGWHISNTQQGRRGGATPQRRAKPQSLKSVGLRGGDRDRITTERTPARWKSICPQTAILPPCVGVLQWPLGDQKPGRHLEPIKTTTVHLQGEGNTSL